MMKRLGFVVAALVASVGSPFAVAQDIGRIKVSKGAVSIERAGAALPAPVGARLQSADVVSTGSDGAVGITLNDDSLLSAGANSRLSLDRFVHEPSTNRRARSRIRSLLESARTCITCLRALQNFP